jgi:hypothetical protein
MSSDGKSRLGRQSPPALGAARGAPRRTIAVVAALAGAVVLAASLLGQGESNLEPSPFGAWAPGIAAPVPAFQRAPRVRGPATVRRDVRRLALRSGGDPELALRTLRVLRSNLGLEGRSLYAFAPDGRAICFLLAGRRRTGACPTRSDFNPPGVLWISGGGIPAWASEIGFPIPSVVAGIAADNVRSVDYVNGNTSRRLAIRNNVFFTELEQLEAVGFLEVVFVSGKRVRIAIAPRPTGR